VLILGKILGKEVGVIIVIISLLSMVNIASITIGITTDSISILQEI